MGKISCPYSKIIIFLKKLPPLPFRFMSYLYLKILKTLYEYKYFPTCMSVCCVHAVEHVKSLGTGAADGWLSLTQVLNHGLKNSDALS